MLLVVLINDGEKVKDASDDVRDWNPTGIEAAKTSLNLGQMEAIRWGGTTAGRNVEGGTVVGMPLPRNGHQFDSAYRRLHYRPVTKLLVAVSGRQQPRQRPHGEPLVVVLDDKGRVYAELGHQLNNGLDATVGTVGGNPAALSDT